MSVIVTGISRGIGQAISLMFLDRGHSMIGTSTTGNVAMGQDSFRCLSLQLDREESINQFVEMIKQENIRIEGIINKAAVLFDKNKREVDANILRQTIEVNLLGTIYLTESIKPLLNGDAQVVNISSNWGSFSDSMFSEEQPCSSSCWGF